MLTDSNKVSHAMSSIFTESPGTLSRKSPVLQLEGIIRSEQARELN